MPATLFPWDQFWFFFCVEALRGIEDLFKSHPAELQSHKYASIQKLRERISDDDKAVREDFYKLFDTQIFPGCKEVCVIFLFISHLLFHRYSYWFRLHWFLLLCCVKSPFIL